MDTFNAVVYLPSLFKQVKTMMQNFKMPQMKYHYHLPWFLLVVSMIQHYHYMTEQKSHVVSHYMRWVASFWNSDEKRVLDSIIGLHLEPHSDFLRRLKSEKKIQNLEAKKLALL